MDNDISKELKGFQNRLAELGKRADKISKTFSKLEPVVENHQPMLRSLMREGLPLEFYSRLALIKNKYEVHGNYPYKKYNHDGTYIERSVDVYATKCETIHVEPESDCQPGDSWPECKHILLEAKQRRPGVSWIFCNLPQSNSGSDLHMAPQSTPRVNAGFELQPGDNEPKKRGNATAIENGIAQLQQAYMPLFASTIDSWYEEHPKRELYEHGSRQDIILLILVTNANLFLFQHPEEFEDLTASPKDEDIFKPVPWVSFKNNPSLELIQHQEIYADKTKATSELVRDVLSDLKRISFDVQIVNYSYLFQYFNFADNLPRIGQIKISGKIETSVGEVEFTFPDL